MQELDSALCKGMALNSYQRGMEALRHAHDGHHIETQNALAQLHRGLEFVTEEIYLELWIEIHLALAEAYSIRIIGDPVENARLANTHYQMVLKFKSTHS